MRMIHFFDEHGNFIHPNYDPYRVSKEFEDFHFTMFEKCEPHESNWGRLQHNFAEAILEVISYWPKEKTHDCDIMKMYYGMKMHEITSGAYTPAYMWN